MLNELVTITKKRISITKTVVYGASMAGAILTPYIEKYPNGADAVGILAGVSPSIANTLKSGCDFLYILSVFFVQQSRAAQLWEPRAYLATWQF